MSDAHHADPDADCDAEEEEDALFLTPARSYAAVLYKARRAVARHRRFGEDIDAAAARAIAEGAANGNEQRFHAALIYRDLRDLAEAGEAPPQSGNGVYHYGEIDPLTSSEPIADQLTALWGRHRELEEAEVHCTPRFDNPISAQMRGISDQIDALELLASWHRASTLKGSLLALGLIHSEMGQLVDFSMSKKKAVNDALEVIGKRVQRHVHSAIEGIDRNTGELTEAVCGVYAEARVDKVRIGRGSDLVVGKVA